MIEVKVRKLVIPLSFYTFLLGIIYLVFSVLCFYNWFLSYLTHGEGILTSFAPPDPWLGIVFIAIGSIVSSSLYYLVKGNMFMCISALLIGSSTAVLVMAIQLLAVIASILDDIITGELPSITDVLSGVLRVDSLLGLLSIVPLILSYRLYVMVRK